MKKKEMLYEGKAKKVYALDDEDQVLVSYKDDATAFNGEKKGTIVGKGVVNNRMSNHLMQFLEQKGIPTHFLEESNERDTIVKKVEIIPLEVIVRNIACGSFSKRYGVPEGTKLKHSTIEFSYKNDDLGDPLMNTYHALALSLATEDEIKEIERLASLINEHLLTYFKSIAIELVDFKLEFGRYHNTIVLADEISPDTCRLWDIHTHDRLDKDRFRNDMGNVEEAYVEVYKRLGI